MDNSNNNWAKVIRRALRTPLSAQEIADLAITYSESGTTERFDQLDTADVASTGGPSSLSTLLTPLFLAKSGFVVPKLGVPGRPAGGLDVLAQIPGYSVNLGMGELRRILADCNYAHFSSGGIYAPLDLEIFRQRQVLGAQAVPELVVASLLSKKIAVDIKNIGLDVRIAPHGNFGVDYSEGRSNSRLFIRVANLLGRRAICILTDATIPFQPFIGRGESLWAMSCLFSGEANNWLMQHAVQCGKLASELSNIQTEIDPNSLRKTFEQNIRAQGSSYDAFFETALKIAGGHQYWVESTSRGFVSYQLGTLRKLLVEIQHACSDGKGFADPCGVRLLVEPGTEVEFGQPLMSVRIPSQLWSAYSRKLQMCCSIVKCVRIASGDEVVNDGFR